MPGNAVGLKFWFVFHLQKSFLFGTRGDNVMPAEVSETFENFCEYTIFVKPFSFFLWKMAVFVFLGLCVSDIY